MNPWIDMDYEMHPVSLDLDTADRLLAGAVAAEDAPPGYASVARFLDAASAEPTPEELVHEAEIVAMFAATVRPSPTTKSASPRRPLMPFALARPRLAAALVAAAMSCVAGLASAGSLPGAAQDVASAMLAKVGISVPGPNEHAGDHPNVRGRSGDTPSHGASRGGLAERATTPDFEGFHKGVDISGAASDGKSHAGKHGSAAAGSAPVETPNGGGTNTADTASGGKSSGTSTADTASGGHSSAGSGNAGDGQETADAASGGRSGAGAANDHVKKP
jgi:hypothetical protein